ncbi:MAG: hypothetical protein UU08_C0004G0019 [Candidatus Uhrbacteria bacterium GW2011_GWE2_40_58]|nr:MAG: hypothetical protein UT94_C0009G0019 [Candidatus Uhrbacteria bacterium GW2011_GWF2_40_263]KKR68032.1 MAG: hypothetical protein UU08_C0004G0019 [Candidatus Uhrbacteria bacterium GW2011_GWE2_40_58]OGL92933.1 MAG: hypothetical protein A2239_04245 [Candidatus Uhrbacteria bacterium RIFOXYA2_FULL_40_9]OGL97071.1 MAG: hypothetical protein A2332_04250 [Candidatus Uhrbacteria bacterium RIFOXYB2_FULL_41_18]HBK34621.1 hypothetical protein [Candidatus Uhrbacteria bacterium]
MNTGKGEKDPRVDLVEFLQVVANAAVRVRNGQYDPAQLHLLIVLLRRFGYGTPLGVTSVEIGGLEQQNQFREQIVYLVKQARLYERVLNREMTVRQFVREYLGTEDAVLSRFLLGLFADLQVFDLLEKAKDEILGNSIASKEYASDEETLERMEEHLQKKFGFVFEMSASKITSLCEDQKDRCQEMLSVGKSILSGISAPS